MCEVNQKHTWAMCIFKYSFSLAGFSFVTSLILPVKLNTSNIYRYIFKSHANCYIT